MRDAFYGEETTKRIEMVSFEGKEAIFARIVQTIPAAFNVSRNASILAKSELSNDTLGIA